MMRKQEVGVTDEAMRELRSMPNVGPATARDLLSLGIQTVGDLRGKDPHELYLSLCKRAGSRQDPCVLDVMMSVVHFAETNERRKWWTFTAERKARFPDL